MSTLGEYIIPYLGLANGVHSYTFDVDKNFFAHFETSKIKEGKLDLKVDFDKMDRMVTLAVQCQGTFNIACDRCTAMIDIPMVYQDTVILKIEEANQTEEEEVIFLDPKTSEIDLAPILYESIHLHLPIMNLKDCESEAYRDCDHEVLDRLEGIEDQSDVEEKKSGVWSELDKLKLN